MRRRAGARPRLGARRCSRGRWRASSSPGRSSSPLHRSIHLAVRRALAAIIVAARSCAGAGRASARRTGPDAREPRWLFGRRARLVALARRGRRSSATGSSTRRACASSSTWRACTCARSTSSRTAACIPGYAFPLWHGFLALVSWLSGVDPEQSSCATSRRCSRRSRCVVACEAGVAVFGSRAARRSPCSRAARALLLRPGPRRLVRDARAAGDRRAPAARPGGDRALLHARPGAATRVVAIFGALALDASDVRASSCSSRCSRSRVLATGVRALVGRVVPIGLVLLWLRPIVDETLSHDPSADDARRGHRPVRRRSSSSRATTTSGSRAEVFGRSGAVAVAALFLLPLIGARAPPALGGVRARRRAASCCC